MTSPSPTNAECEIAASILKRAVELELKKRYTESIVCYQEGIQILLNVVRSKPFWGMKTRNGSGRYVCNVLFLHFIDMVDDSSKSKYRTKIQEYLSRAETLKGLVEKEKSLGNYRERFTIEDNSCGYSYQAVFGRFFDHSVVKIEIDDPYIRLFHQVIIS